MNTAHVFRRSLAHRLILLLALPAAGASFSGCFIGTSCPDNDEPTAAERCFTWPPEDAGTGGSAGGGSVDPLVCPSRDDATTRLNEEFFASHTVKSDGTLKNGQCCYATEFYPYCEGRPYLVEEVARTAPALRGHKDGGWDAEASSASIGPTLAGLEPDLREALAAEWTRDALFEHASVASFGRFALELLAAGAPADLVEDAHRAALDEVRHARLCFGLASAYAGEPVAPGMFPFHGATEVEADLASIATRTAKEGCIGETIAAVIAAEQLAGAKDPAVAKVLAEIAADEARHAELAWRTVAWAIRVGDARVRAAVEEVFAGLRGCSTQDTISATDPRLAAHGRLAGAALSEAAARAIEEVVRPAARVLLSGRGEVTRAAPAGESAPRLLLG